MDTIKMFQEHMRKNRYDAYIIPTSDYHNSEYISDHFKAIKFLTGFTGSAGTLVITKKNAYLWVDGRYYIQASKQIAGQAIEIMRQGEAGVPTVIEFLADFLEDGNRLAFDGRILNTQLILELKSKISENVQLITNIDLVKFIWDKRPSMPFSILFRLDTFFSGKDFKEKLSNIRDIMKQDKINTYIIGSLEDQAWLYNLRGNDVKHTPVFLAFTIITDNDVVLFIDQNKIDIDVQKYLDENGIIVKPYFDIYDYVKSFRQRKILMDFNTINYQIYSNLYFGRNQTINRPNPTSLMKAIKNEKEIHNIKEAHIKDGLAFTKFMYFVKNSYKNKTEMTELSLTKYLDNLRKQTKGFVDISFDTICAFKEHGAMMHYTANEKTDSAINKPGFLLIDSGGHYLEGTTDITRTLALGRLDDLRKMHFTTVLKSVIALSTSVFLRGTTGQNLDVLARAPIWKQLLDYKSGTGHGVGYLLSVHEGPNYFRYNSKDSTALEAGMITTNEPGIYLENKYGIRIENELLCVDAGNSRFGDFLKFETLTIAPIDLDAVDINLLTNDEKEWLNEYHKNVYDVLSPLVTPEEREWLAKYTRMI